MKQFESHGVTFFHNEDFSGDIHMQHERGAGFHVPFAALRALVAPGMTLQLLVQQDMSARALAFEKAIGAALDDLEPRDLRHLAENQPEFAPLVDVLLKRIEDADH